MGRGVGLSAFGGVREGGAARRAPRDPRTLVQHSSPHFPIPLAIGYVAACPLWCRKIAASNCLMRVSKKLRNF